MDSTVTAAQGTGESLWDQAVAAARAAFSYNELVLQISPLGLVLIFSPLFLRHYSQVPVYLQSSPFPRLKLLAAGTLICLELSNLLFRRVRLDPQADTMVAAALIDLVAALTIGIVLYIEQRHNIRTSMILVIFLFLGCIIDVAKCHLFIFDLGLTSAGVIAAAAGCIRLALLALEIFPQKTPVVDENAAADGTAEQRRPYFVFPSPFIPRQLLISIKNGNLMPIPDELASDRLHTKLRQYWEENECYFEEMNKKRRDALIEGRPAPNLKLDSLVMECIRVWKPDIRQMLVPRLVFAICTFSQPFILKALVDVIRQDEISILSKVLLITLTLVAFAGVTIAKSSYGHMNYLMVTRLRGSFITQIVEKTHRVSAHDARLVATITLMSNDIESIAGSLPRVLELPITLFETIFGIYFLSRFVGTSSYLVLVPVLTSNILSWFWGYKTGPAQAAWNESAQIRVSRTSTMLHQLPGIKMMGLGPIINEFLQRLRAEEMRLSARYRSLETVVVPLAQFVTHLTPVWIVGRALARNVSGEAISPSMVFPILALVAAIQGPLGRLLDTYSTVASLLKCFDRVQEYLSLPDRDEYRHVKDKAAPPFRRAPSSDNPYAHPVELVDIDLAALGVRQPILYRVDLALTKGSVTAIVGPPGSGKSTLLQCILGEASLVQGSVCVQNEDMALCGQVTWLQDVSILDNIIGPLPYNADFFKKVIQCCLLQPDLQRLPGGADFIVGPGGRNLTFGQRQRVGIARTVYSRTAVMLFDDPFGALDRRTAVTILFHLCGANGLLREMGVTVAMVSNYRDVLDVSDRVLLLDGQGYASLEEQPFQTPAFASNVETLFNSLPEGPSEEYEDAEDEAIRRSLEYEKLAARGMIGGNLAPDSPDAQLSTLYLKPIGYISASVYAVLVLCLSFAEHIPNIYIRRWYSFPSEDNTFFTGYASAAAVTCLTGTLSYWILFVLLAPRASLELHKKLLNAITGSTLAFLGVVNLGSVLSQFDHDASQIARHLPFYLMRTLYTLGSVAIKTSIIVSGASYFVSVLPLIVAALYYLQVFYFETARELRKLDMEAKAALFKRFEETADGIVYMRAFGWLRADMRISFGLLNISQRAYHYVHYFQQWLTLVLGLFSTGLAVSFVTFVLFFPKLTSEAAVGLSFLTLSQFSWTLERLFEVGTFLETSMAPLERLRAFLDNTPQEKEHDTKSPPAGWPWHGKIEIEEVTARYEPNAQTPALHNLTFVVEPGQRAGLIGRTGSGKTSVLNAMLRFIDYDGVIKIDGLDISTLSRDEVRSRLITISQEQVRFDATIRVNLLPFTMNDVEKPTDEAEKEKQRAKKAEQDAALQQILTDFGIWENLRRRQGLDTLLDNAGYSPTEVQLLCIARAVLRQRETGTNVILVDEVTTGVDFWRQDAVQDIMRDSFPGCTLLVAAHVEESVLDVSVVFEMSKGVIMHAARRDSES